MGNQLSLRPSWCLIPRLLTWLSRLLPVTLGFLCLKDMGDYLFGVSNAISIAISGYLAKRLVKSVFSYGQRHFSHYSLLCGFSDSLGMLILYRVLQAVAGPVIPLSQSLIMCCYPPKMQNMALAFWSMTIILAPVFGPIFGGYISDNFHWGWIFFMNVPLGISLLSAQLSKRDGVDGCESAIQCDWFGTTFCGSWLLTSSARQR